MLSSCSPKTACCWDPRASVGHCSAVGGLCPAGVVGQGAGAPFPGTRSQPRRTCGAPFYRLSAPNPLLKPGLDPEGGRLWRDWASVRVEAECGPAARFSELLTHPAEAEPWRMLRSTGGADCSTDVASRWRPAAATPAASQRSSPHGLVHGHRRPPPLHSRVSAGTETPLHVGGSLMSPCAPSPRVVTSGSLNMQPQHGPVSSGPSLLRPAKGGIPRHLGALRAAGPRPPPLAVRSQLHGCRSQWWRRPTSAPGSLQRRGASHGRLCDCPPDRGVGAPSVGVRWPRQGAFLQSDRCHCQAIPRPVQGQGPCTPQHALFLALSPLSQGHFAWPAVIMLFTRCGFGNEMVFFCSALHAAYLTRACPAIVFVGGHRAGFVAYPLHPHRPHCSLSLLRFPSPKARVTQPRRSEQCSFVMRTPV